jgi:putative FmdB family regulatory protein
MPIYTYRCENCGVQFERQQSFNDATLTRCPECNKDKLRRVITPAGIVFKGSGWYINDHKSKSGAAKSPTPVKTGSEAKSESKDASSSDSTSSSSATANTSESSSAKSESSSSKGNASE